MPLGVHLAGSPVAPAVPALLGGIQLVHDLVRVGGVEDRPGAGQRGKGDRDQAPAVRGGGRTGLADPPVVPGVLVARPFRPGRPVLLGAGGVPEGVVAVGHQHELPVEPVHMAAGVEDGQLLLGGGDTLVLDVPSAQADLVAGELAELARVAAQEPDVCGSGVVLAYREDASADGLRAGQRAGAFDDNGGVAALCDDDRRESDRVARVVSGGGEGAAGDAGQGANLVAQLDDDLVVRVDLRFPFCQSARTSLLVGEVRRDLRFGPGAPEDQWIRAGSAQVPSARQADRQPLHAQIDIDRPLGLGVPRACTHAVIMTGATAVRPDLLPPHGRPVPERPARRETACPRGPPDGSFAAESRPRCDRPAWGHPAS